MNLSFRKYHKLVAITLGICAFLAFIITSFHDGDVDFAAWYWLLIFSMYLLFYCGVALESGKMEMPYSPTIYREKQPALFYCGLALYSTSSGFIFFTLALNGFF